MLKSPGHRSAFCPVNESEAAERGVASGGRLLSCDCPRAVTVSAMTPDGNSFLCPPSFGSYTPRAPPSFSGPNNCRKFVAAFSASPACTWPPVSKRAFSRRAREVSAHVSGRTVEVVLAESGDLAVPDILRGAGPDTERFHGRAGCELGWVSKRSVLNSPAFPKGLLAAQIWSWPAA
ncbi:hypothetical protein SKAU_G00221720 [Synaphobranchus kaupii]|uniref:Uncharacterized protein n=1 Tax=Synaphobranchus kaupii TaxID=118154 RepID=A0A9Q1FB12_SYNKA|nr:hypothetical protein SKAU_G00221720 [Synaphobranchus kaupii]